MIQNTFHITDFTDGSFEKAVNDIKSAKEYDACAQLLITYYSHWWVKDAIESRLGYIHTMLPKAEIVGCTHNEWDGSADEKAVISAMYFENEVFSVYGYSFADGSDGELGRRLNADMHRYSDVRGVMLFTAEVYHNLDTYFSEAEKGYDDVPFFGAPAASDVFDLWKNGRHFVFIGCVCYTDYITAVIFHGRDLHIKVSYNFGWKPIGKTMTVTETSGDFDIVSIDGGRASDIYRKYLGLDGKRITVSNMCEFPLAIDHGGITIARIPMKGEKNGMLRFMCDVKKGDRVRFSYGAQWRIFREVEYDSFEFSQFVPQGMMLIICANRILLLKDLEHREVDYYREVSGDLSYLHGNSEIYRLGGKGGELNSALIAVGIREGDIVGQAELKNNVCSTQDPLNAPIEVPLEFRVMTFLNAVTEDLIEAVKDADAASEAKSRFLSNMSHEIRTPINAVLGMNEMIMRDSTEPQVREYARDIENAGKTLLSLVNDILDFSKIESGKMELVPVKYSLAQMIRELGIMIGFRARDKGLALVTEISPDLPCELYGDNVRIKQVLTNILTNAVKYTPEGSVTLRVSGHTDGDDAVLRFEVEDTGIGIKEEDMPKLFEAFERIEEKRNRSIEGTGLGMSITVQLLALMDSKLEVDSVYGKGSRFWFVLRQKITDASPLGEIDLNAEKDDSRYGSASFTAPDAEILAVDDNELNLKVFVSLLRHTGMKITTAKSGAECLELTENRHFDIIFLDHMMPGLDGIETLHRMKSYINENNDAPNAVTPVFALTANAVSGAAEMYRKEGFDGFVSKPIDHSELEKIIRVNLPARMIHETEDSGNENALSPLPPTAPAELPAIDGLDWRYARINLPDDKLLRDTVKEFCELMPVKLKKLNAAFGELDSGTDTYRIEVHAMKSSAAMIGLIQLSGMARKLEMLAKDGDVENIRILHPMFTHDWEGTYHSLDEAFGSAEQSNTSARDGTAALPELLGILRLNMEDMDIDAADRTMERILSFSYDEETAELLSELKAAVTDLDEDKVNEVADRLTK